MMESDSAITTSWTEALEADEVPCPISLRTHLLEVHRRYPGFTEGCATKCKDSAGHTSYEWLCDVIDPARHRSILDLACGSGFLLELCRARFPQVDTLTGVDMSPAELALARRRLSGKDVTLHERLAQDLSFAKRGSLDAVLCHWALTLMDPIEPVLREIDRVLAPGGVFTAIVDGDPAAAPGYAEINDLVFQYVRMELPTYGDHDLGDPRTRTPRSLAMLARSVFKTTDVSVETSTFTLEGKPASLALEAAGFFYAAYILPAAARKRLLTDLAAFFHANAKDGVAAFCMPVCRLVVRF
jgi:ubiquinone/menaquinone biosynthesis C-methylase UbiE